MTDSPDAPYAQPRPDPRPDARLVALHAERGDPHTRLAGALAALEGADWGLTLAGEAALARQLAALLGPGVLRVDERLGVNRAALAGQGLAAAGLDADWTGARGVWLAEPDDRLLRRAARAGVPVIVDATLAPGGGWTSRGAAYVVYRDPVTLTGFGDGHLALLFGPGRAPAPAAPAPADLTVALALRDVATLPLRLARAARTTAQLAERLGGGALPFGPTALLLPPDAAPDTPHLPGGVLAATRSVEGGVIFTPGLQDAQTALALLRAPQVQEPVNAPIPLVRDLEGTPEMDGQDEPQDPPPPAPVQEEAPPRRDDRFRRDRGGRPDRPARADLPRPDQPQPDVPRADAPRGLDRVTFDAPEPLPPEEAPWTPEIVFSSPPPAPAPLPTPVSAGPDAPELEPTPPLAAPDVTVDAVEETPAEAEPTRAAEPEPEPTPTLPDLPPDLPTAEAGGGAPDPAANLTDEQAAVYARLREWRNAEAKRQEVSRFIIASNATLAEIARRVPYTLDDLRAVRGMGPERLRKYGEKILEVVRG
ncbi:HRDC domain-containing protein [Deinococcus planocerae]|uniref:HRDC domain-containing protein n=1 Tax=Deinococcus planocerae TaxID=1737569 RepID=UPI000C7F5D61|nr:HRDC domain-containing protein [Deinococcus planocerae]